MNLKLSTYIINGKCEERKRKNIKKIFSYNEQLVFG